MNPTLLETVEVPAWSLPAALVIFINALQLSPILFICVCGAPQKCSVMPFIQLGIVSAMTQGCWATWPCSNGDHTWGFGVALQVKASICRCSPAWALRWWYYLDNVLTGLTLRLVISKAYALTLELRNLLPQYLKFSICTEPMPNSFNFTEQKSEEALGLGKSKVGCREPVQQAQAPPSIHREQDRCAPLCL